MYWLEEESCLEAFSHPTFDSMLKNLPSFLYLEFPLIM